jgi:hypothetical protein
MAKRENDVILEENRDRQKMAGGVNVKVIEVEDERSKIKTKEETK